jgi:hypothetical protein
MSNAYGAPVFSCSFGAGAVHFRQGAYFEQLLKWKVAYGLMNYKFTTLPTGVIFMRLYQFFHYFELYAYMRPHETVLGWDIRDQLIEDTANHILF